jgi:acyl carrier protein
VEDKIRAIMADILKVPADTIGTDAAIGSVPNWDSTAHMKLVLALEDEFGIVLHEDQIVEMTSFPRICATVRDLRVDRKD